MKPIQIYDAIIYHTASPKLSFNLSKFPLNNTHGPNRTLQMCKLITLICEEYTIYIIFE